MKKRLFKFMFLIFPIILTGCGNDISNQDIQISELKIENHAVVGKIKNINSDKMYNVAITLELTSGNLTENGFCYTNLEPKETKELNCVIPEIDETYSVTSKIVTIDEINDIEETKINNKTAERHFGDILKKHKDNVDCFTDLSTDYELADYISYHEFNFDSPFTEDIYEISVSSSFLTVYDSIMYIYERYDILTKELTSVNISFINDHSGFKNKAINTLLDEGFLSDIVISSEEKDKIINFLLLENSDYGEYKIGKWIITKDTTISDSIIIELAE